ICNTCNIHLGKDPKKYIEDWFKGGIKTRLSSIQEPIPGGKEVPINWLFLSYCYGETGAACYFCDNMTSKKQNIKRSKSGRPKVGSVGNSSDKAPASSTPAPGSSSSVPVLLMVPKGTLSCDFSEGSEPLQFSDLSASGKHAVLVGASQQENLAGQLLCSSSLPLQKSKWTTFELEGGVVAMGKYLVDDLKEMYGSECVLRLSGDSGGGLFKLLALPVNTHVSHYDTGSKVSPYLVCIGDIAEKRDCMVKVFSDLEDIFREYQVILSGDMKWIQVVLGLTVTGCPYCTSSGRYEKYRMVYDKSEPLRTTARARELAATNKGRGKSHVNGQRYNPLIEFDDSPFVAIACPVLHLGMNLAKAVFGKYVNNKEERQKVESFLSDNYGIKSSLPTSSSAINRSFLKTVSLTGKDCAALASKIAGQRDAGHVWQAAGFDAAAADIIAAWGRVRQLVYCEHGHWCEENDWISEVSKEIERIQTAIAELDIPVTLSLHVLLHHLVDSLRTLENAGIAAWSITEEVIESLHGTINREASVSMINCMSHADGIAHLGATYNTKRKQVAEPSTSCEKPRRSCASYSEE
ncbi:hypothetical protein FOL47_002986, partial [Perkinsus chesapeaki]